MSQEDNVGFLYKTMIERDPKKRRVKPIGNQTSLLDFDLGESSDDSDFRIEDHSEETDDDSVDSNDIEKDNDSESQSSGEGPLLSNEKEAISVKDIIEKAQHQVEQSEPIKEKLSRMLICCGCLGDRSDDINEIVECDGCGVTVHEGCYGVSDVESFSSTDSLSQSAPWFCEACSAGVEDPCCELCPNKGGIFKETDVGKWVHLVCALYVPGVAFGEVDRLTSVTLFEMPYSKWGAKACCLCMDVRYARTGVCIECDAGMCHTYFHVTCAQKEGLLSEAHSEEVDQADPFYAHCKLHSDRMLVRKRKRNWLSLQLRATYRIQTLKKPEYKETEEFRRIQRKLSKHRQKYLIHKESKSPPWVPTQKMPRQLTTSASAVRSLQHKAELMGVDTVVLETQDEQIASLMDIRKKWHIPPAFSVEFISYYIDRMARINSMKARLEELVVENTELLHKQQELDKKYDETMKLNEQQTRLYDEYERKIEMYNRVLKAANYIKPLPLVSDIAKAIIPQNYDFNTQSIVSFKTSISSSLQTSKSSDADYGNQFLSNQPLKQSYRIESLQFRHQCGICRRSTNQHLLAKCDTCHLHYHLSCLTPPLTRMPKKTKLMGWQCSECDKETSSSEIERVDTLAPRRLRHCKEEQHQQQQTANFTDNIVPISTMTIIEEAQIHKPPSKPRNSSLKKLENQQQHKKRSPTRIDPNVSLLNENSVSEYATSHTPKLTIKPIEPHQKEQEHMQVDSTIYNHCTIKNSADPLREGTPEYRMAPIDGIVDQTSCKSSKKRRREKHKKKTPDSITGEKQRKRKHKRKNMDVENSVDHGPPEIHRRITIKIKPIPMPEGEVVSDVNPQMFVASSTNTEIMPSQSTLTTIIQEQKSLTAQSKVQPVPPLGASVSHQSQSLTSRQIAVAAQLMYPSAITGKNINRQSSSGRKSKSSDLVSQCTICNFLGTHQNSVMCDECKKCYHFSCLDPPVKKSPKRRGYSWHCADCDPSASDPDNTS